MRTLSKNNLIAETLKSLINKNNQTLFKSLVYKTNVQTDESHSVSKFEVDIEQKTPKKIWETNATKTKSIFSQKFRKNTRDFRNIFDDFLFLPNKLLKGSINFFQRK